MMSDPQMELLRGIVMKRHKEWKKPHDHSHWFYLIHALLILSGLYMIANAAGFGLSPIATNLLILIVALMLIIFLLLLQHNIRRNSPEGISEMVEREIHMFNSERLSKR